MQAALTPVYGPPSVLTLATVQAPALPATHVRVRVGAAAVTAGDRRLRAADFPGISALFGRLMFGLTHPRRPIQGTMFAGVVEAVGDGVTTFQVGDRVFGTVDDGAYAELLTIAEDAQIAPVPPGVSLAEACALPYGAVTARHFLVEEAGLQAGERVLILGASGGIGRLAVQLARHLGAHVTAVCSRAKADRVYALGAQKVLAYEHVTLEEMTETYDVIFDIADVSRFSTARERLTDGGRYLTLSLSVQAVFWTLWTRTFGRKTAHFGIAMGSQEELHTVTELLSEGALRPVVGPRFALENIQDAHEAEASGAWGTVVVG